MANLEKKEKTYQNWTTRVFPSLLLQTKRKRKMRRRKMTTKMKMIDSFVFFEENNRSPTMKRTMIWSFVLHEEKEDNRSLLMKTINSAVAHWLLLEPVLEHDLFLFLFLEPDLVLGQERILCTFFSFLFHD